MGSVIAIGRGHAGKEILVGFAGQQIAVIQRCPTEIGQQRIARAVNLHRMVALKLNRIKHV